MTPAEVRARILEVTLQNGGHLASSLGAVEIACALHEVFDPEKDRIVWDVGHQAYAWKILNGRNETFDTLRKLGGISGFPNPKESKADAAVAGHAGMAMSVALGYAAARDQKGTDEQVVAVVGDASMANGVSFEALNNVANSTKKLIVVLNDNEMSIGKPIGAFSKLLGKLITGVTYNRIKAAAEETGHRLKLTFLREAYHQIESRIKGLFLANRYFEQFGLRYIGPIDGHDMDALRSAFTVAKNDKRSVLVHVVTKKGKGYEPAEQNPTKYHGISPKPTPNTEPRTPNHEPPTTVSWSDAFGQAVCELARTDSRICALTAAMKDGTGLVNFAQEFPTRFFDVGIAEEHLLGFSAGLAAGGMRPIVAIYSTFLQRAVDQVMHDLAITNLPVIIGVDRAGVVGADGVTHQGVYDLAMLRAIPNVVIAEPKDAPDLKALLQEALARGGVTIIRYPRGTTPPASVLPPATAFAGTTKYAVWSTGDWYLKAQAIASRVNGIAVHARYLKPIDESLLASQRAAGMKIISLENAAVIGGLGDAIKADMKFGWPDEFIPHGTPTELEKKYTLDVDSIVERIRQNG